MNQTSDFRDNWIWIFQKSKQIQRNYSIADVDQIIFKSIMSQGEYSI